MDWNPRLLSDTRTAAASSSTRLQVHDGSVFTQADMLVPWESATKPSAVAAPCASGDAPTDAPLLRYYHLFVEGELDALVAQVSDCRLLNSFHEQGNWFVEFERTA